MQNAFGILGATATPCHLKLGLRSPRGRAAIARPSPDSDRDADGTGTRLRRRHGQSMSLLLSTLGPSVDGDAPRDVRRSTPEFVARGPPDSGCTASSRPRSPTTPKCACRRSSEPAVREHRSCTVALCAIG